MGGFFTSPPGRAQDTTLGSARFAGRDEAAAAGHLNNDKGFLLGALTSQDCFYHRGHVLTCAPTGAGKGTSAVIPNLLIYPGSTIVMDIKGENYAVTAANRRRYGQQVYLLDPFKATGDRSHRMNPIDLLKLEDPACIHQADSLADMLVISSDKGEDRHWDDTAKGFLKGLILFIASLDDPAKRTMMEIRRRLFSGQDVLNDTLADMASQDELAFSVPARAANSFILKADKEQSGLLSTIDRHTEFLDDPLIAATLSCSDFQLLEIKDKPMTVYLVIPLNRIKSSSRYLRLILANAINAVTVTKRAPVNGDNVAFMIDEFSQLRDGELSRNQ